MATVVDSFEAAAVAIQRMIEPIQNPDFRSDDWQDTISVLESLHRDYFATSVSPEGEGWAPLAEYTIKKKGHDRILFETDRLFESLTSNSRDSVRELGGTYLEFGTRREWAWVHQIGSSDGKIPARPHTGISETGMSSVLSTVADAAVTLMALRLD